jgi:hypothetical protein
METQPVPRVDTDVALADIERRPYEQPLPQETLSAVIDPSGD